MTQNNNPGQRCFGLLTQIEDINAARAYPISCDESSDVNDIELVVLLCRHVNSDDPQEDLIKLVPLEGQIRGEDTCDAVIQCLKSKGTNTQLHGISC